MKLPRTCHNRISYVGASIAILALMVFIFLLILDALSPNARAPYAGLLTFMLVPAFLLFGLVLIPIGMAREWQHLQQTGRPSIETFPVVDLNVPYHRNAAIIFVVGSTVLLFLTVFGSFELYEVTESVAFCGTTCHSAMEPEHTAYKDSPHSRVRCVECHVGAGAEWYAKSKFHGLYQLYGVLFDSFERPIPSPVTTLRPAQDTCEQCHWPGHFFPELYHRDTHFLFDEKNTRWDIDLLLRVGGGGQEQADAPRGSRSIHWHVNPDNQVEYIAKDTKRQEIPWVRVTDRRTGKATEYSAGKPMSAQAIAAASVRTMDCMDCHNRPSHQYRPPVRSVNLAMAAGRIDPALPFIKKKSVELLAAPYLTREEAVQQIDTNLKQYYQTTYPEAARTQAEAIAKASTELQAIYGRDFFPRMKVRWDAYPDNIGHTNSPGCFRCHDDDHKSPDGKVLNRNCSQCHTIQGQGGVGDFKRAISATGLTFEHPGDVGDVWESMACTECHKGIDP